MKKIISNLEIAKMVVAALEAESERDPDYKYEYISVSDLADLIDSGRSPEEEETPVSMDHIQKHYIEGYLESMQVYPYQDDTPLGE